jgi:hypothetical protein
MGGESSAARQAEAIARDRQRIAAGQRPAYRATWAISPDGAVDVRIAELPIIHLFVPDPGDVPDGARLVIARTLAVAPDAFDVVVAPTPADA